MKLTEIGFAALVILTLQLGSCQDNSKKEVEKLEKESLKEDKKVAETEENSEVIEGEDNTAVTHEASFLIKSLPENDMGNPSSDISLKYNGKIIKLANIMGNASLYGKAEFEDKDIPKDAISACGAWWAGAGDYFYLIPTKKGVAVYQGWQDEGQEDTGYHWKKLKEYVN